MEFNYADSNPINQLNLDNSLANYGGLGKCLNEILEGLNVVSSPNIIIIHSDKIIKENSEYKNTWAYHLYELLSEAELIEYIPKTFTFDVLYKNNIIAINLHRPYIKVISDYLYDLLGHISYNNKKIIFVMFGSSAIKFCRYLCDDSPKYSWNKLSSCNNCTVFNYVCNELYNQGKAPKSFLEIEIPYIDTTNLWVFTDGATLKKQSRFSASWAYFITNGIEEYHDSGNVKCTPTNNRAELTALIKALKKVYTLEYNDIIIVTDSEYVINTYNYDGVRETNADVISKLHKIKNKILNKNIKLEHIKSHQAEPSDTDSIDWFKWRGNDIADKLCNLKLGRIVKYI